MMSNPSRELRSRLEDAAPAALACLAGLLSVLLALPSIASAGPAGIPDGYETYHSVSADFDGDGHPETATAVAWKEGPSDHPPHLLLTRGDHQLLDLWLKDTNALSTGNRVPHEALQSGDLTHDGAPELLFIPSSAGGSGGTQYVRVVHWNGQSWASLKLTHRAWTHLSENDGAIIKNGVLYLYQLELPRDHYRAQRFTYVRGALVGGRVSEARKRGKEGFAELGL